MISVQEAKRLSLIKWECELHGTNYRDILEEMEPTISTYFHCGFCLRHGYDYYNRNNGFCDNCEVKTSPALGCCDNNSLYERIILCDELNNPGIKEILIKKFIEILKNIPDE